MLDIGGAEQEKAIALWGREVRRSGSSTRWWRKSWRSKRKRRGLARRWKQQESDHLSGSRRGPSEQDVLDGRAGRSGKTLNTVWNCKTKLQKFKGIARGMSRLSPFGMPSESCVRHDGVRIIRIYTSDRCGRYATAHVNRNHCMYVYIYLNKGYCMVAK